MALKNENERETTSRVAETVGIPLGQMYRAGAATIDASKLIPPDVITHQTREIVYDPYARRVCPVYAKPFENMRKHNMFAMSALNSNDLIWLPNPDQDSAENLVATLVNSGRNTLAVITAQKIGRDQEKTTMAWSYLSKTDWETMLRFWDNNFFFMFYYYSRVQGTRISRKFYISDRKDKPYDIDDYGIPTAYKDCTANVIDTGEGN